MSENNIVTINGTDVEIDAEAAASWEMFELVCEIGTEFDQTKMPTAFKLIELCTGIDKDAFIELCGGKRAPYASVLSSVNDVLTALIPKN